MSRTGMSALIIELRALTLSGTNDYTIGNTAFYSDDMLQSFLDRTRLITKIMPLRPIWVRVGAATLYLDYAIDTGVTGIWFEQYTGADAALSTWAVKDGYGVTQTLGSAYTVNYDAGLVTFPTDQAGKSYLLDCYSYGMYGAAAMVWREKAGFEFRAINFSTDKHHINSEERYKHCLERATYFESKSDVSGLGGIAVAQMYRTNSRLGTPNWNVKGGPGNLLGTPLFDSLSGYKP